MDMIHLLENMTKQFPNIVRGDGPRDHLLHLPTGFTVEKIRVEALDISTGRRAKVDLIVGNSWEASISHR